MLVDPNLSVWIKKYFSCISILYNDNRISTTRGLHIHLEQNKTTTDNALYGTLGNLVEIVTAFLYLKEIPYFKSYLIWFHLRFYVKMVIKKPNLNILSTGKDFIRCRGIMLTLLSYLYT